MGGACCSATTGALTGAMTGAVMGAGAGGGTDCVCRVCMSECVCVIVKICTFVLAVNVGGSFQVVIGEP